MEKKTKEKVLNEIENRKREIVQLCCDLISIRSENPPGYTEEIACFLRNNLEESGFEVNSYEPRKGIVNLVTTFKGSCNKPNLVLNGHMDVFPAGDEKMWKSRPFHGHVESGKIYGRGAADMKGGLAASIFAFTLLGSMKIGLYGKLTLAIVSDEESGGKWGTEWLMDNVPEVLGDACIIGEPSALQVRVGEKGICWLKVKARGRAAHGAYTPVLGDNAIMKMTKVLQVAESLREISGKAPIDAEELFENAKAHLENIYPGLGRVFDHVSVNVGKIRSGTKTNIVPDLCEAELDIRVPMGVTPEKVLDELRLRIHAAGLEGIDCSFISKGEANYTSPSERVVELACKNSISIAGDSISMPMRGKPSLTVGGTDGRFFRIKSIPTVVYGPTEHNMGAPDEYITIDDLIKVTKVHAATLIDYYNL